MARIVHIMTVPESLGFLRGQLDFMHTSHHHDLHVITSPGPQLDQLAATSPHVKTYPLPITRQITPMQDLRSLIQLIDLLRRIDPDLVHAHTPKAGLLGMIAASALGINARIYHMRGLPLVTATGTRRALLAATERISCSLARSILCVSHSLRQVAIDEQLAHPDKLCVLAGGSGNGVDALKRFHPDSYPASTRRATRDDLGIPHDAPTIAFIGRLVRDKGVVELERAWQLVRREHPNAHLIVAGPQEQRDAVPQETLTSLQQDPRVHMLGFVANTPPIYLASDIITLPTYREGFPNVPLEAAAMAKPTVATLIPGCTDAIDDNVTGLLVPPRDHQALAHALSRYLDDPILMRQHGESARARVLSDFDQRSIWHSLAQHYDLLLTLFP